MPGRRIAVLSLFLSTSLFAAGRTDEGAEGRVLYLQYCSSCHGTAGDGHGPVAPVLRKAPADLRRLGARYGTPLSAERIARFIDGRDAVAAHGPREMPVWGERFAAPEPEQSGQRPSPDARVAKLVGYLVTIQDGGGPPR